MSSEGYKSHTYPPWSFSEMKTGEREREREGEREKRLNNLKKLKTILSLKILSIFPIVSFANEDSTNRTIGDDSTTTTTNIQRQKGQREKKRD